MVFTVVGCSFIMAFGFEVFFEEFYEHWWGDGGLNLEVKYPNLNIGVFSRKSLVFYEAFMSSACFLSLGGLCLWHARLISAGQTSIEAHINRSEERRLAQLGRIYHNPYNFGTLHNWYLFLGESFSKFECFINFTLYCWKGLVDGRGWLSVLLPSRHKPVGDGLSWDSIYNCKINFTFGDPSIQKLS